jgi:hypothetical protein
MPLQRACDAENQAGNTLSNGPPRAQSKEKRKSPFGFLPSFPVFCDVRADVKSRGYAGIPLRSMGQTMKKGGTADFCIFPSLTEAARLSVGDVFYFHLSFRSRRSL